MKHTCNPQATLKLNIPMYQCGCGRYWSNEDEAIKQQKKYYKSISKEFEEKEKNNA